jgi:hypothetical protein
MPAVCLLLALSTVSLAQGAPAASGQIRGQVVEVRTAAPLPAVLVQVESTRQRAISNAEGRFTIDNVPPGAQVLVVSVVGFGLVRREVTVTPEGIDLTIPVAEGASTYIENVAVTADRLGDAEPGAASQAWLGSRELLALRGVIADDPFRAVQVLPSITANDDFRAEFAVRGLGPYHVGLSIDGVDSPLLFHTVRGVRDTGSLAFINSDILEEATVLTGVHPQRLSSHLGARLDFRTRDGARDRLHLRALVSGSATTAVGEGPVGDGGKGSWLVAARKSYIDWLLRKVDPSVEGTFGFADAQAKITLTPTPSQTLRVSMLGGRSALNEHDDPGLNSLDRGMNRTIIGNVHWRVTPSSRLAIGQQLYLVDGRYQNRVPDGRVREEGRDRDLTWRGTVGWSRSSAHLVEVGAQAQWIEARRIDRRFLTPTSSVTTFDADIGASSQAGWVSYRWMPTPSVVLIPGARVEHWALVHQTAASPWLLAEWQLGKTTRARGGFGVQRQAPGLDEALVTLADDTLVPERARVVDLGLEQRLADAWRASVTGYYRYESDRLRLVDGEPRLVSGRVVRASAQAYVDNVMDGEARGAEVTVERRAASGLVGWFSYAWGHAENTDHGVRPVGPAAPQETFAADWDQRHTVNVHLGYRWSERSSVSARYRYGSGFPLQGYYAPADGEQHVLTTTRNVGRLPPYARFDVRADRAFTYRRSRLTLFAEVINVLNRSNFRTSSAVVTSSGDVFTLTEELFPVLPSAGILIEF